MDKNEERIKVAMRCRPLVSREKVENQSEIIFIDKSRHEVIIKDPQEKKKKPVIFTYDFVYDKSASQDIIYEECARPIIEFLLKGFNCTIFAYGQTGTGKTFTMEGGSNEEEGIIPRTFKQIFERIKQAPENEEYLVRVSMLEIYKELLKDSLSANQKFDNQLEIHGDSKRGFYVKDLQQFNVSNIEELSEKLEYGKSHRQVRATEMNDYSSRSHSIFTIIIESSVTSETGDKFFRIGKLNLVDLAGSEKTKQTKTSGEALKEGIQINLSLTNLINVINLLVKSAPHIPYRDSKLTKLLADSLGGNSKTIMIANIGPAASNYSETIQTLKYANRAKQIKNKPKINEDAKDALLRQKQEELIKLRMQIQQMGMGNNEILRNIDSLNMSYMKIENSSTKKDSKENFDNKQAKLIALRSEEEAVVHEKENLQRKIQEQQEKLRLEESEKEKLIQKYNQMCNGIITKHDYDKDIQDAKKELEQLKNDKSHHQNYIQSQKILEEKKKQVNQMDAKSKQIQESINKIHQSINEYREKISYYKNNKLVVKTQLTEQTKILTTKLENNRMILKKQLFYLQNLIPKNFVNQIESLENGEEYKQPFQSFSINGLRKPICLNFYSLKDSYINSYVNKVKMKKIKHEEPTENEIYDNDFQDDSISHNNLNLKFYTGDDGKIWNPNTKVEELFNQ